MSAMREQIEKAEKPGQVSWTNQVCLCVPACRRLGAGMSARRQEDIGYGK
jgi:hypothetical protein